MMLKEIANSENTGILGGAMALRGVLVYWAVLALFYALLTFRSMLQDWSTPLEIFMARLLPFTYLTFHHVVFRGIIFQLIALAAAWGVVRTLRLTGQELGWVRPSGIAPISGSAALGIAFCALVSLVSLYGWIVINGMYLGKYPNAYQLLWSWPVHIKMTPGALFENSNFQTAFSNLNALVLGPVVEEVLFRGVLFAALRRKLGSDWTILITALLDVLVHYNLPGLWFSSKWSPEDTQALFYLPRFAQLLSFSIVAGWLRSRRATLPELAAFHSAHNLAASSFLWSIVGHG